MGNRQAAVHRSFILIGKLGDGKSTLGNLITGGNSFVQHRHDEAAGLTRRVDYAEAVVPAGQLYQEDVRMEVFDQPGLTDPSIRIVQHSRNLMECVRRAKPLLSVSFLIVVNLAAEAIEPDLVKSILSLAEHLARSSYSFFNNAMVVFTRKDEALGDGVEVNRDNLVDRLNQKCETPEWKWLQYILDWVDGRYMFVNAMQRDQDQRLEILRELFFITKPKLRIMFHGNPAFKGSEMQRFLGVSGNCTIDQVRFRVECIFNQDLETHDERRIVIEDEIRNVGLLLKEIGQGISVMVVLIGLTAPFTDKIENKIKEIPSSYALDQNEMKWWEYSFVIFKVRNRAGAENEIDRNLKNHGIKDILEKSGGRYTYMVMEQLDEPNEQMRRGFRDGNISRICTQCLEVKKSSEGKDYIESLVLKEMESIIEEMKIKHGSPMKKAAMKVVKGIGPEVAGGIGGAVAMGAIGVVGGPITIAVGAVAGGLMGVGGGISVRFAYYVLKKLKPEAVNKFQKKFPNLEERISKEEFYNVFIGCILPKNDDFDDLA